MKQAIALTLACLLCGSAEATCPVGSYRWVDGYGNTICRSLGAGVGVEAPVSRCPAGTTPTFDLMGNRTCQASQRRYYDTSRQCPVGTYPARDRRGTLICKPM